MAKYVNRKPRPDGREIEAQDARKPFAKAKAGQARRAARKAALAAKYATLNEGAQA